MDKNQNINNTIRSSKYMLSFVLKKRQGKIYILLKSIISLINAIIPLIYTIFPGLIINELLYEQRINIIISYIGILIFAPLINHMISITLGRYLYNLSMALTLDFRVDFFSHIMNMDYETYENPDLQVTLNRSKNTIEGMLDVVDQLINLLSSIFSIIAITSVIINLNFFIIILIICLVCINSLVSKWANHKQYLIGRENDRYDRREGTFIDALQLKNAKETRLFNLRAFFIDMYFNHKTEYNKLYMRVRTLNDIVGTIRSISDFIQQGILYAYSIYCVIANGLPVGSMTIYMAMAGQFSGALNKFTGTYIGLSHRNLYIQELMGFMDMPLRQYQTGDKTPVFDKDSVIEFRNVSFKYPGSECYAVKNMSITFHGDEKLCIVGSNGSGKSTFIKLLTRLYFPTEGEILLNNININEFDYEKYQRLFAPVFQDFAQYFFTLEKNIVLANEYNKEHLDEVCSKSGLVMLVDKLTKGYDTQVGKWVDETGFDPSGGEGQRIAIARAIYHGGEIFLLDEPTAALDPLAEYEIYTQFNEMITDKSAILITHRLSAVQLADKVAVFDNGSLVEYGTHKELYGKGGVYTEMYNKQALFYRDAENAKFQKVATDEEVKK